MTPRIGWGILVLVACLECGCRTPSQQRSEARHAKHTIRNNAYSLLHELLSQQKNVGLVLIIKNEGDRLNAVVRQIAKDSNQGAKLIEQFAAEDETISLADTWLPPAESAAREEIASVTRRGLLHEGGDLFEFNLLIAQSQALPYAEALAKVAAEHESHTSKAEALKQLGTLMHQRHQEVVALLRSRR